MNILAIDSCSNVATCAIVKSGILVGESVINNKKTHSVKLLPLIDQLLKDTDTDIFEVDYYAVTVGPGSFTGQRIGISTIKGLCHATGKKCVGVSTLEALAHNVPLTDFFVCPIMDARREQVYTATFKNGKHIVKDRAIALTDLLAEQKGKNTVFVGDGVAVFRETITDFMGEFAHFPPLNFEHLRAGSVAAIAKEHIDLNLAINCHLLTPLYLRKSQAEREYLEKTHK
ncbi:MAG: tRNA (adenosine(37)-N6)-threonylcarbamoyltransferase complex dimerization subunit type 1 TsaB [Firmicutes bacterium]|nr:tRNA (adenosine(37)-N6)-threonylcarbamoyltransferase complex dimerization subunit type 1 TsaB [Bacillota bacterium]